MGHMTASINCEYVDYNLTVSELLKMTCHSGGDVVPQDSNSEIAASNVQIKTVSIQ